MSDYIYKCFRTQWGIYIKINAEHTRYSISNYTNMSEEVMDGVYFYISDTKYPESSGFSEDGLKYLRYGLGLIADKINETSPFKNDTLIIINAVQYSICDFQEEGIAAAIIGWAANEFGFRSLKVDCTFNNAKSHYKFNFG